MFCPKCGAPAEEHYRYCSKCGNELSGVAREVTQSSQPRNMQSHVTALGWLFMVSGALTGLTGIVIVIVGRMLPSFPVDWGPDVPANISQIVALAAIGIGMMIIAIGVGTFMAGYGLLQYKPWARVVAIIAAIIGIFHFPLGTALGIYALWVLLSEEGRTFYEAKAATSYEPRAAIS